MNGIDLNSPIAYKFASFRYFEENERHVTRFCEEDVLLLLFDGVLRFTEDGRKHELHPGEYHIQKHDSFQTAEASSDCPKYLYVHFYANWTDGDSSLCADGKFDCTSLMPQMEELDRAASLDRTLTEQAALFLGILSELYRCGRKTTVASKIADYISMNYRSGLSLDTISSEFHFSKGHIINLFRAEFGVTPFEYMNRLRLRQAEILLSVSAQTAESIACECGFSDYSHFYKAFRETHGISPAQWRKKIRKIPHEIP